MDVKYIGGDEPWTLPFGDHFYSASQTSITSSHVNNEDLQTIARRYDFQGLSALESVQSQNKKPFPDPDTKWMNAGVFFTDHTIEPDYPPVQLTDYHDDHGHTFCYLCSINAHDHPRRRPRPLSQRRKLITYENPKALKPRPASADRSRTPAPIDNLVPYRFIVRTDSRPDAGTRAQVYLYMYGTENNWTSIHLRGQSSSSSVDGFPSGSTRTFCLKGPDIGVLHHLNVNLVGARSDRAWFLKEIEITNLKTSVTWICQFNCWLPKKHDENPVQPKPKPTSSIERPLPPISTDNLTVYIIQVHTGSKAFAGTDSHIEVDIRGSISETRSLSLTSDQSDLFEQNQIDTFLIIGWDLGQLTELIVKTDDTQMASEWDLKEMIIWKILPSDQLTPIYFPFNQWLGGKTKRLKSKAEIYRSKDHRIRGPICYFISIKTGSRMNAGTDANVYIQIYGQHARTTSHLLDNVGVNDFERGTTSNFTITDIDVGGIDQIRIWHDNTGASAGWYLDSVTIRKKHSLSRTVSNNFIERLELFSKLFYDQAKEKIQNEQRRQHREDRDSMERMSSSRSILRSPIGSERSSAQKRVSWDTKKREGSPNSRGKNDSIVVQSGHFEHYAKWISSHSFDKNRWQIKSIEDKERGLVEPSVRTSLLSDRSSGSSSKVKVSGDDRDDDTYEFEANRWLADSEGDKKLEVTLQPKSNRLSSATTNEQRSDPRKKPATKSDLRPVERSPRSYDERGKRHTTSEPTLRPRAPIDSSPHHSVRNRTYASAYGSYPE